jgi:hypothetical protein
MSDPQELTEHEQQKMNTGRLMRAESDFLLPYLNTKQNLIIAKIVASFRAGDYSALTGHAAELTTISDMRNDITNKIKQAEILERKAYGIE